MKKKALIFGGIVLVIGIVAVTCAVLFLDKDKDNSKALEFKEEYEKVNGEIARYKKPHRTLNIPEDNPYIKTTPAEILKKIENKETFYLYVGDHLCPWCRSVIEQSIKSAKENGVVPLTTAMTFFTLEYGLSSFRKLCGCVRSLQFCPQVEQSCVHSLINQKFLSES